MTALFLFGKHFEMRKVYLVKKISYDKDEIDAVDYCKRYGEHLLAVRIVNWRNQKGSRDSFIQALNDLIQDNQDSLIW